MKEISVFKSKKTMKSLGPGSFAEGKPNLDGGLPPMVADIEAAKALEDTSENAADSIESFM